MWVLNQWIAYTNSCDIATQNPDDYTTTQGHNIIIASQSFGLPKVMVQCSFTSHLAHAHLLLSQHVLRVMKDLMIAIYMYVTATETGNAIASISDLDDPHGVNFGLPWTPATQ